MNSRHFKNYKCLANIYHIQMSDYFLHTHQDTSKHKQNLKDIDHWWGNCILYRWLRYLRIKYRKVHYMYSIHLIKILNRHIRRLGKLLSIVFYLLLNKNLRHTYHKMIHFLKCNTYSLSGMLYTQKLTSYNFQSDRHKYEYYSL